ncbi:MAG: hypothetical protein WB611_04240 [Stellaceae bacterium]
MIEFSLSVRRMPRAGLLSIVGFIGIRTVLVLARLHAGADM